jgi:hypothetical protein
MRRRLAARFRTPGILDNVVILEIPCLRYKDGRFDREIVPVKVQ